MTSPSTAQAPLDEEAIQRPRPRMLLLAPVLAILLAQAAFQLLTAWTTFRLFGRPGRAPEVATIFAVLNLVATVGLVSGRRFGWIMAMSLSGWNVGYYLVLWWIGFPSTRDGTGGPDRVPAQHPRDAAGVSGGDSA